MLVASVIYGCRGRNSSKESDASTGFTVDGDIVTINGSSPIAEKIKLETLNAEAVASGFVATAAVSPRPEAYAEIGIPFGGRVTRSFVRLGDRVHKGQVLYEISSADYMEAVKGYVENNNAYTVAESNLRRKKTLHQSGIVSDRELEDAQREASDAEAALALSKQVLTIFGASPASVKVGQPLRVITPVSGVVVKNNLVLGQILSDDDEPPMAVADLSSVRVTANVKADLVSGISKGQEVGIESQGQITGKGKVFYVGEMLDDKTHTVPVVIECPNPDKALKPGMFVSARFSQNLQDALTIPSTAVFQGHGSKFVYVRQEGLVFKKIPVEVQSLPEDRLLVLSGLQEGDTIISDGGIYLSQ